VHIFKSRETNRTFSSIIIDIAAVAVGFSTTFYHLLRGPNILDFFAKEEPCPFRVYNNHLIFVSFSFSFSAFFPRFALLCDDDMMFSFLVSSTIHLPKLRTGSEPCFLFLSSPESSLAIGVAL